MTPGEYIRELREARGLNKSQLAKMLGAAWTTINNWELHGAIPERASVTLLADKLSLTAAEKARLLRLMHVGEAGEPEPPSQRRTPAEDKSFLDMILAQTFDPKRHTIEDAHAVLRVMGESVTVLRTLSQPRDTGRAWLDGAAQLRERGLAITAPTIAAIMLEASKPPVEPPNDRKPRKL